LRRVTSPPDAVRVYVIDDDPAVLDSTVFLLRAMGYECDAFADPRVFLARIQTLPPACILTDLRMPGMDGWQLASELRARSLGWPLLLMSSDNVQPAEVRDHGFTAFLRKPLDAEALAEVLDSEGASLPPRR
jgi:two-component system, LuxR family, response regulator FixJ